MYCRFDGRRYHISAILVITLRFISGISCGAVSPAMFSLLGRWIPTYERSRLTALSVSGQMVRQEILFHNFLPSSAKYAQRVNDYLNLNVTCILAYSKECKCVEIPSSMRATVLA